MTDAELVRQLNKILTLEHGHLGMYKDFSDYQDKDIRRAFRRFMEIEIEHINKLKNVTRNLGAKPSILIESGDIIGQMLGISFNLSSTRGVLETLSLIEKKSHQGYFDFVSKLEEDAEKRSQFIAEFLVSNMLEAKLMHLWLEDKLNNH
ncbi:MAG TPA: demethoxyubiquinone hydroxylase family protein [Desulfobacteria bacterium]|nr:demethoxyubiquinone hydroxylase family protein [Desulfobacteria bacterium]